MSSIHKTIDGKEDSDYSLITPENWCSIQYLFGDRELTKSNVPPEETIRMLIKQYRILYEKNDISSRDKKRIVAHVLEMIDKLDIHHVEIDEIINYYVLTPPLDSLVSWIMKVAILDLFLMKNLDNFNQYVCFTGEANLNYFPLMHSFLTKLRNIKKPKIEESQGTPHSENINEIQCKQIKEDVDISHQAPIVPE